MEGAKIAALGEGGIGVGRCGQGVPGGDVDKGADPRIALRDAFEMGAGQRGGPGYSTSILP